MTVSAIQATGAIPAIAPITASDPAGPSTSGADFGAMVAQGLQKLQQVQHTADDLAVQAATGRLTDVHDYMIAATEASLATSLTVAVRNKALESFNEIMRMQA
ncbi:flagellar hook-basal body complex protein FliE [Dactylosporangium sp. NPDC005555]|uniref:flagellar hook-basal body complex protein FliE n=1 Tax=Dactylosporangium sp. NPDC005555 TaxID=3154889 RepID=UPI00339E5CB4